MRTSHTTPTYTRFDDKKSLERNKAVIRQFRNWLEGRMTNQQIREYYYRLGKERRAEGFILSELLSALSLTRKHFWEFALSQGIWNTTIDIYMALELERNMMLFFDRAAYHMAVGYEAAKH